MSFSVVRDGRLWGLISCHHETPRAVPYSTRRACELVALVLSLQLAAAERQTEIGQRVKLRRHASRLLAAMGEADDFAEGLLKLPEDLLAVAGAAGAAVISQAGCRLMGRTPEESDVRLIAGWLSREHAEHQVVYSDALSTQLPEAKRFRDVASGLLVASISPSSGIYVMWFRPEVVQTVVWAGDPRKVPIAQSAQRLNPRTSFEAWTEKVHGTCEPWTEAEIGAITELRAEVVGIVLRKAELERRNRERARSESERRLKEAVVTARLGTFDIEIGSGVVNVNDIGRRIYGWNLDETVTAADVRARLHPADKAEVLNRVQEAMDPARPGEIEIEHRIITPDGSERWIRARFRAVLGDGDTVAKATQRLSGTYLDVTDSKQIEVERQRMLENERTARVEAEHINRMKDEFLATLSHELRTPLNAILGWSQLLRGPGMGEDDLKEGLAVIERNSRIQVQLVEDLLDMSRIISGKLRIEVQPVDLAGVIALAIESVMPAADAKTIRIQAPLDSRVPLIRGDAGRLQQVVWNLLSNAIKFTPKAGSVLVSLRQVHSHVELSVTDSGIGIDTDFLPYVFERFRQADGATTRKHGGLGLGLAIVKGIVESHGGRIEAASAGIGRGAAFRVQFPVMLVEGEAADRRTKHPAAVPLNGSEDIQGWQHILKGVNVLVVDNEADARELVRRVLESCQASVTVCESAAEAMQLLERERPQVLLSDIGMPGEDGYAFIRRVRELPAERGGATPAAALTAFARSGDRRRALVAGYQTHLAKPVEPTELVAVVASLAGRVGKPGT